ncbi:MAG: hypothetical protein ACPGUV_03405 [Polyangiales bacterium]
MPTQTDLADAIAHLVALKEEHAPILQQIVSDTGMHAATRETLVAHLREEEDEALQVIVRAHASAQDSTSTAASARPAAPRLSVGSLRGDQPYPARTKRSA